MGRLLSPVERTTYDGAFKDAVAALRDAEVPFACMGSLALWALGGPSPNLQQDLDFAICERDAVRAKEVLAAAGFAIEQPPEDWLFKAWSSEVEGPDSALIDLIFRPAGLRVTPELLGACERRSVLALDVGVLSATDLLVTKLHAITEQAADFTSTLQFARSLRERIDWQALAVRVADTPFGVTFLVLVELLGIAPGSIAMRGMTAGVRLPEGAAPPARGLLAGEPEASMLARIAQCIAEDERSATLDVVVTSGPGGRIVLRGDAANAHHRSEVEQVVRELAPEIGLDNLIEVRAYEPPHDAEAIG